MILEEIETIIILNKADLREGFFRVSTNSKNDFKRIAQRIGGEIFFIDLRHGTRNGQITEWIMKIPSQYISLMTFAIGIKRKVTESQKEAARKNMKKMRSEL